MATYTFTGEQTTVFPTIGMTVNAGDSFDAPDDFVSEFVTLTGKTKKVASIIEPEIDLTPVPKTAPETTTDTIEPNPVTVEEGTK